MEYCKYIYNYFFLYAIYYLIFNFKKRTNYKFKGVTVIIVIVGVISIINASNQENENHTILLNSNFSTKTNFNKIKDVVIDSHFSYDIHLLISYLEKGKQIIPIDAKSYTSGFVSGFQWELNSIHLNENRKYTVNGFLNWNLLGIEIYKENKIFEGIEFKNQQ